MIYLDNAASTMVSNRVLNAMMPYFKESYGNAGSIHTMGRDAAKAVEKARAQCAKPLNTSPDNIIFTSGGSEANTLAIIGLANYLKSNKKTHIITTKVEHPSVLAAMKYMFYNGFEITYLPVNNNGELDLINVREAFRENTGLVSVMTLNNETGNMYRIDQIGHECKSRGVLFHTDAVQAYGNMQIDVDYCDVDFLSASGHKFHSPKGVGFLFARNKHILSPIILGGGQEFGIRSGTENVPSIVGIGEAASAAYENNANMFTHGAKRTLFINELSKRLGKIRVNGSPWAGSKTINICFDGVDGETLLLMLNNNGVIVSAGSACSAHSAVPSHVLKAIGLSDQEARSSIRFSLSSYTTDKDICDATQIVADSVRVIKDGILH